MSLDPSAVAKILVQRFKHFKPDERFPTIPCIAIVHDLCSCSLLSAKLAVDAELVIEPIEQEISRLQRRIAEIRSRTSRQASRNGQSSTNSAC